MKHPFAKESAEKRYAYVLGVAIVAIENGDITPKKQQYLEKLIQDLVLEPQTIEKILITARRYQLIKQKITSALDDTNKKYCFLMDIYNMYYQCQEYSQQLVGGIEKLNDLLEMTNIQSQLIKQMYGALVHQNKWYLSNVNKQCEEDEIFLGEEVLKYFAQDETLILEKERVIQKGEELRITKNCKIVEMIRVLEGAKIIFDKAIVDIYAPIEIRGGTIEIKNSDIYVKSKMQNYLFLVENTKAFIENSKLDGNSNTGIWCQANGELTVVNSIFQNTSNRPAIYLWECQAIIKQSQFIKCIADKCAGGAVYTNSNLAIYDTTFDECSAYKGAAIYQMATTIPFVENKQKEVVEPVKKLFGRRINYIPIPKTLQTIPYSLVLQRNIFYRCKSQKQGVVCMYQSYTIKNEENNFKECIGRKIGFYE